MNKYISILRGINVGGHRKILMADLKTLYMELGFENPISYIQSGNVIFETSESSEKLIEEKITNGIKTKFGFDVPVIVRTNNDFKNVVKINPFFSEEEDIKSFHITFLSNKPSPKDIETISELDFGDDVFEVLGQEVHLFIKNAYHKTKLSNQFFEKKLNCSATTRNWKTVNKLIELTHKI